MYNVATRGMLRIAYPQKYVVKLMSVIFQDTVEVAKKFMARDPEEINFTLCALAEN